MNRLRAAGKTIWSRSYLRIPLITVSALLAAATAFGGIFVYLFVPIIRSADFPPPADVREAQRQDLEYFRSYPGYDRSFSADGKREAFDSYVTTLLNAGGDRTEAEFELAIARGAAIAGNGHSNVSPVQRSRRMNRLPIRFARFAEGYFVLHTTVEHAALLGARIEAVGGVAIGEVVGRLEHYTGGLPNRAHHFASASLNSPMIVNALGIAENADQVELTVTRLDGELTTLVLGALPSVGPAHPAGRAQYAYEPPAIQGEEWVSLMAGKAPPEYLHNVDDPFDHKPLGAGYYVRIDANQDWGGHVLHPFLQEALSNIDDHEPAFVVVDLRENGGGTTVLEDFVEDLLSIVPNDRPIFVITSAGTFSYGIATAVLLKMHGGDRVVTVGEPVGDRLRFWANGGTTMTLPNSRIALQAWSSLEDFADGCWHWRDCFWFSRFFRRQGIGALPVELPAPPLFGRYRNGRDNAIDVIVTRWTEGGS